MPKPYPLPANARAALAELLTIDSPQGWGQCLAELAECASGGKKYRRSRKDREFELYCLKRMVKAMEEVLT